VPKGKQVHKVKEEIKAIQEKRESKVKRDYKVKQEKRDHKESKVQQDILVWMEQKEKMV
jgi:hypothetical protein